MSLCASVCVCVCLFKCLGVSAYGSCAFLSAMRVVCVKLGMCVCVCSCVVVYVCVCGVCAFCFWRKCKRMLLSLARFPFLSKTGFEIILYT